MNRKQRNLEYIRVKNRLRKGGEIKAYQKINSCSMKSDKAVYTLNKILNQEAKKYKMELCFNKITADFDGDDFANNLVTAVLTIKKK